MATLYPLTLWKSDYPLDNPFDSLQGSWISWCPALGFWMAL